MRVKKREKWGEGEGCNGYSERKGRKKSGGEIKRGGASRRKAGEGRKVMCQQQAAAEKRSEEV